MIFYVLLLLTACRNGDDPEDILNPGECEPEWSVQLPEEVKETSGLLVWDDYILTHNDSEDTRLYLLDPVTGDLVRYMNVAGYVNQDWEDVAMDEEYIYLGDFGNNADGARTNLVILKISKTSVEAGDPEVEMINFHYEGRKFPDPVPQNNTDFDCEAMIAKGDSLYLFTKQWTSGQSTVFRLPKDPGEHVADSLTALKVDGLITGATSSGSSGRVVLCGYTILLEPFLYVLEDFPGDLNGLQKPEKIRLSLDFHQLEGIDSRDGRFYYLSNEKLQMDPFPETSQMLHMFDLEKCR